MHIMTLSVNLEGRQGGHLRCGGGGGGVQSAEAVLIITPANPGPTTQSCLEAATV